MMAEAAGQDMHEKLRGRSHAVWQAMQQALYRIGFDESVQIQHPDAAEFRVQTDPSDGQEVLVGVWLDEQGFEVGQITLRPDYSFYAEQTVLRSHPRDTRWFVEAVTTWGDGSTIKSEPRLLPALQ